MNISNGWPRSRFETAPRREVIFCQPIGTPRQPGYGISTLLTTMMTPFDW